MTRCKHCGRENCWYCDNLRSDRGALNAFYTGSIPSPEKGANPIAYPYVRVSDIDQVEHGLGMRTHEGICIEYWQRELQDQGVRLGKSFLDEAVSASKRMFHQRPAGKRLLGELRRGDYVLVSRLDRGFRNQRDMLNIKELWDRSGVQLILVNMPLGDWTTAGGQFQLQVMGAQAEYESRALGERVKLAVREARKRGEWRTCPPAGFKTKMFPGKQRKLVVDQEMLPWMKLIYAWRKERVTWPNIIEGLELHAAKQEGREPRFDRDKLPRTFSLKRVKTLYRNYCEFVLQEPPFPKRWNGPTAPTAAGKKITKKIQSEWRALKECRRQAG